jgi:hypothetical protein
MSSKRKVVDAKQDSNGNISHVKLEGNQNFTPRGLSSKCDENNAKAETVS